MFKKTYGDFVMASDSTRMEDRKFSGLVEIEEESGHYFIAKYNPRLQWIEVDCQENIVYLNVYTFGGRGDTSDADEYYYFMDELYSPPFNYMREMLDDLWNKVEKMEVDVIEKNKDTYLRIKMKNTDWISINIPKKEYWLRPLKKEETYILKVSYFYTKEGRYKGDNKLLPTHMLDKYVSIPIKSSKVIEQKFASEKYI